MNQPYNKTTLYLTPAGMFVCAVLFFLTFGLIGYLTARLNSPDLELEKARVESLYYASEFAKWEAVGRTFAPVIDLSELEE